jgi:hypothetical protein
LLLLASLGLACTARLGGLLRLLEVCLVGGIRSIADAAIHQGPQQALAKVEATALTAAAAIAAAVTAAAATLSRAATALAGLLIAV